MKRKRSSSPETFKILADAAEMKRKRSSSPETSSTRHGSSEANLEVFLSFRGPDTRANFTDILYYSLLEKGIGVFIDKEGIDVGEEISPKIFQAIDDSKICIPIFSKDYASSAWCLRELEHMMQRWKTNKLEVMPIFYDVEPFDLKLQTEVYMDKLVLHKEKHGAEIVERWTEALNEVTGIKGWEAKGVGLGELAHLIARKVSVKLKVSSVHISDQLVGMDESVNEVLHLLNVESEDIRLIGIWGMGGIGKTTLAKVVFNKLSTDFDSYSFISDIRESARGSLSNMQRRLISDIIGNVGVELHSIDHGRNMIKNRFCMKKVLIFLDDVDHESQLMALAAKKEWFGSGSRIVVTTRDKSLFYRFEDQFDRCLIHEVKELGNFTALQLFSKHAFRSNSPPNAFLRLSEKVIEKTGGLPLAIEVIGSFLCGKKEEMVWQDALKKMEYHPHKDVEKKLMLSYNELDYVQQEIFLDIACFLAGEDKSYAYYMWDDCGFFPNEGIDVLLLMSLVKIGENNKIWMHDQLKDLGRAIVYREYCKDLTKGSRVWNQDKGPAAVLNEKGIKTVAVFYQNFGAPLQDFVLTSKDFIEVPHIRVLEMFGPTLSGDFMDLFSELRWLSWLCCTEQMHATNFCPKNLVILDLSWSKIDEHWGGWTQLKVARRLKVLNMSGCLKLSMAPDLSAFLCLEILILKECRKLVTLPNSIGMLRYLIELDISETCISELPITIVNIRRLKVLKMNRSRMQKLPEAIGMLEKLEEIYGEGCTRLEMIPSDIVRLSFLKILKLTGTHIKNVPKLPQSLVSLCLSTVSEKDPEISNLVSLKNLELCFPLTIPDLPFMFPEPPSQEGARVISRPYCKLELSIITSISSYLDCFCCLKELELKNCQNLHCIGQLPSSLMKLTVGNCDLLEVVDLSNLSTSKNLKDLEVWRCWNLVEIKGVDELESLESIYIKNCISLLHFPSRSNWKKMKWHVDVLGRNWQEKNK